MNSSKEQGEPVGTQKKANRKENYQMVRSQIGRGAYSRVHLVQYDCGIYAMKEIQKKKLIREKKVYQAYIERELLIKLSHPGILKLKKCFHDSKNIYYVMEYCPGGDMAQFIKNDQDRLSEQRRKFYVAQMVQILEYLRKVGIAHRDLKLQNILISESGHLKLIDYGTSEISKCSLLDKKFKDDIEKEKYSLKENSKNDGLQHSQKTKRKRKSTFVGTPEFLSPELLEKDVSDSKSDLWALGCIVYQLYYGKTPFQAPSEYQLFQNIKNMNISFPTNESLSEDGMDLIKKLLKKNPEERLGYNNFNDLKRHPYFETVNFEDLFKQEVPH